MALEDLFSELVYAFDKSINSKGTYTKKQELNALRNKAIPKSNSNDLTRALKEKDELFLDELKEKEFRLMLQLYSLPKTIKLEQLINNEAIANNLSRMKKCGSKSPYFKLLKDSIESSLALGITSLREKASLTSFALTELDKAVNELEAKEHMLPARERERLKNLKSIGKIVLKNLEFFEKELKIAKEYSFELRKEINEMK